jgi:hypothetical protein
MFQLLFTAISVSIGITANGDIRKNLAKNRVQLEKNEAKEQHHFDQDYGDEDSLALKISTGFAIWNAITTVLALFGICTIALNLSYISDFSANIIVSLVVWALFFMMLIYLEARILNTLVEGLISTATMG